MKSAHLGKRNDLSLLRSLHRPRFRETSWKPSVFAPDEVFANDRSSNCTGMAKGKSGYFTLITFHLWQLCSSTYLVVVVCFCP